MSPSLYLHRRDVGDAGLVLRGVDGIDHAAADAPRRDLAPALSAITGHVQQAVVGARPQRVRILRAFLDGEDRVVHFEVFVRVGTGTLAVLVGLVARQVRADGLPVVASVRRFEQHVRRVVDDVAVVPRNDNRRVPVEAVFLFARRQAATQYLVVP